MARVPGNEGLVKRFMGGETIEALAEEFKIPPMRIAIKLQSPKNADYTKEHNAALAEASIPVRKKFSKADIEAAKLKAKEEARAEYAAELEKGAASERDSTDNSEIEGEGEGDK